MSGLILERARANHEDVEVYEAAIVAILEDKPRTVCVCVCVSLYVDDDWDDNRGGEDTYVCV